MLTLVQIILLTHGLTRLAHADAAADQAYQAGLAAYTAADYPSAIKNAEAAVAADPKLWQAWQLDGNARYALGDKAGAATVYQYALQINPDNHQLKMLLDGLKAPAPVIAPIPVSEPHPAVGSAVAAANKDAYAPVAVAATEGIRGEKRGFLVAELGGRNIAWSLELGYNFSQDFSGALSYGKAGYVDGSHTYDLSMYTFSLTWYSRNLSWSPYATFGINAFSLSETSVETRYIYYSSAGYTATHQTVTTSTPGAFFHAGAGLEYRGDSGFVFRLGVYDIEFFLWPGMALGYAF